MAISWQPATGKQKQELEKITWRITFMEDLRAVDIPWDKAEVKATDRSHWRTLVALCAEWHWWNIIKRIKGDWCRDNCHSILHCLRQTTFVTFILFWIRIQNKMKVTNVVCVQWWSNDLLPHWSTLATNWTGVGITITSYNRSPSV